MDGGRLDHDERTERNQETRRASAAKSELVHLFVGAHLANYGDDGSDVHSLPRVNPENVLYRRSAEARELLKVVKHITACALTVTMSWMPISRKEAFCRN